MGCLLGLAAVTDLRDSSFGLVPASQLGEQAAVDRSFVALTCYHRKHAIRVLRGEFSPATEVRLRYRVYDQAVAQKNGAVVRRLVGYGCLSGVVATKALCLSSFMRCAPQRCGAATTGRSRRSETRCCGLGRGYPSCAAAPPWNLEAHSYLTWDLFYRPQGSGAGALGAVGARAYRSRRT